MKAPTSQDNLWVAAGKGKTMWRAFIDYWHEVEQAMVKLTELE